MYLMNREGRAILYIAFIGWLFFGFWGACLILFIFYSAFLGDDSFETEELAAMEKMAYSLPPHDMELEDMEGFFFYKQRRNEHYEDTMNF
jgi:hypothetical protein